MRIFGAGWEEQVLTEFRTYRAAAELRGLCQRYGVRRLELFGSAALGEVRPGAADLDFLVEFGPHLPGGYANAFFGLQESLEGFFGRSVDLVVASAIRNPYFLEAIAPTRTLSCAA
jgi:predicted nucleotidyltransferase